MRRSSGSDTATLTDREHFGFRDGISQPTIDGLGRTDAPANTIKAGEFVLGYQNEYETVHRSARRSRPRPTPGACCRSMPIAQTGTTSAATAATWSSAS